MNAINQIDRDVPAKLLTEPAIADGDKHLSKLYKEFEFLGIESFHRKVIYSLMNGSCAVAFNPEAAAEIVEKLKPEGVLTFPFLEELQDNYSKSLSLLKGRHVRIRSLSEAVKETLNSPRLNQAFSECPIHEQAWCAFAFCVGSIAQQRRTSIASHIVERCNSLYDNAEAYLLPYVIFSKCGHFAHALEDPIQRFLAICYPRTAKEAEAICETFARVHTKLLKHHEHINLNRLFRGFHDEGIRCAKDTPERLRLLITDIETHLGSGIAAENARLFREYIGDTPSIWTPEEVWSGVKRLVAFQQPHIVDSTAGEAKRMHDLAFFQRMVDAAYWSGLFAGRPEAFDL